MGGYQRYEAYQDSGVEWLGEIPSHWEVCLVKRYFNVEIGRMLNRAKSVEDGITKPYLRAANIHWNEVRLDSVNEMEFPEKQLARYQLQMGDLLVTEGGVTVGRSAIWNGQLDECYYQNSVNRVRPYCTDSALVSFLLYWMYFVKNNGYIDLAADMATFGHLTQEKLQSLPMSFPPLEEQKSIARFLDYKTAQIDALIAKKESLLKKLAEKRSALISQAVTKGLDPQVPMKDSGIEWLGEIPRHWIVSRAKFVADIFVPQRNKPELNTDEGLPWLTMEDMRSDHISSTLFRVSKESGEQAGSKCLKKGAVIASCVGDFGITAINDMDVIINQQLQAFIPKNIVPEYLREIVRISHDYFQMVSTAATIAYVNQAGFARMPVVLPPLEEQKTIIRFLQSATIKIDGQKEKVQQAIVRLKEYRTALITNAVTGAIDVRNVPIPKDLQEAA
jgi:type I restriction enzyme, S subunit